MDDEQGQLQPVVAPRRQGLSLDALQLYGLFGHVDGLDLAHPDRISRFLEEMRHQLENSLGNESRLHGWRAQDLFFNLVISFGKARLVKTEDAGQIYSEEDVKPPDVRVVLPEGECWLIEVKNFNPKRPSEDFAISLGELEAIERYCLLVGDFTPRLAVYWVPWNSWTLTPLSTLTRGEKRARLSFPDAMKANEMVHLGDYMIGTEPPLSVHLTADQSKTRRVSVNDFAFTIGGIEFRCGDRVIESKVEQNIAFWLMMFGSWHEEHRVVADADGNPREMIFEFAPVEWDAAEGFAMVGMLSAIFSGYYNSLTLQGDKIRSLHEDFEPGKLGLLIPDDYEGRSLPLWRFRIQPK